MGCAITPLGIRRFTNALKSGTQSSSFRNVPGVSLLTGIGHLASTITDSLRNYTTGASKTTPTHHTTHTPTPTTTANTTNTGNHGSHDHLHAPSSPSQSPLLDSSPPSIMATSSKPPLLPSTAQASTQSSSGRPFTDLIGLKDLDLSWNRYYHYYLYLINLLYLFFLLHSLTQQTPFIRSLLYFPSAQFCPHSPLIRLGADGVDALSPLFSLPYLRLTTLALAHTRLCDDGLSVLASALLSLTSFKSLVTLDIASNHITPAMWTSVCEIAAGVPSLTRLNYEGNLLDPETIEKLRRSNQRENSTSCIPSLSLYK